ncbi:MAG: GGDEF domain-containing protein [Methylococcales bacterium]
MATSLDHSINQTILEAIPNGMILIDNQRIVWVNQAFAELLGTNRDQLIGLDRESTGHSSLVPIFGESDRFRLCDSLGEGRWFERQIIRLEPGSSEIHLLTDISRPMQIEKELERLKKDLKQAQSNHPVTGLLNHQGVLQALDSQLTRSRRYENPLSLLRFTLKFARPVAEIGDSLKNISQMLKDQLRWADQIGMIDDCTFLILLPETSLSAATNLAVTLATERTDLVDHPADWSIAIGVTAWQKGDDQHKLLNRLQVDQPIIPALTDS